MNISNRALNIKHPFRFGMLLYLIVFGAAVCSLAQGGPPMITDDTGTVPKGHWEINSAFTIERTSEGNSFGTPLLDINYGLSQNTQLKVEIPWIVIHNNGSEAKSG
ncbi:MAG: hypothetical protein ACK5NT_04210, partial [Pyrinomonadaceae bacterium]